LQFYFAKAVSCLSILYTLGSLEECLKDGEACTQCPEILIQLVWWTWALVLVLSFCFSHDSAVNQNENHWAREWGNKEDRRHLNLEVWCPWPGRSRMFSCKNLGCFWLLSFKCCLIGLVVWSFFCGYYFLCQVETRKTSLRTIFSFFFGKDLSVCSLLSLGVILLVCESTKSIINIIFLTWGMFESYNLGALTHV
jgi:hypothetical protein